MRILISGASRGIGLYLLEQLSKEGFDVHGTYNTTEPQTSNKQLFSKVDVTNIKQVRNWIHAAAKGSDKIVLINCAGITYNAMAHKAEIGKWKHVIEVNLIGSFHMTQAVLPIMRANGFGRIINISSVVAQKGVAGTSAYAASKAALWGLAKCIASENAQKGITINNLNLGYFDIGIISDMPPDILETIRQSIPMQEYGHPDNIYKAIKFLVDAEYLTGTSIDINGGLF